MVFGMLKCRKNKEKLLHYVEQNRIYWENLDEETGDAVKVLLRSENLLKTLPQNKAGGVNMCQALEELYQDGINEGISQGISQGINQGVSQGAYAFIREYSKDGYDEAYITQKLVNIFSLTGSVN